MFCNHETLFEMDSEVTSQKEMT